MHPWVTPCLRFDHFGVRYHVIYAMKRTAQFICGTLMASSLFAQFDRPKSDITTSYVISKVQPEYTEQAKKAGLEGEATVRVRIDEGGFPQDVSFFEFKSSGKHIKDPLGLDEKAVEAVKLWRFHTANKIGTAISLFVSAYVQFRLPPSERLN
jgi:TonB family protein